jgi:hypothetical protein
MKEEEGGGGEGGRSGKMGVRERRKRGDSDIFNE